MRKLSSGVVVMTLVISAFQVGIPVANADGGADYYLALGDSGAVGFQPNGVTGKGYVDDLWRNMRRQIPGLKLRNVACVGETSGSLITGKKSECHYAAGSQLDAAVSFLQAHPGQVAFITINIGSNDIFARCIDGNGILQRACVIEMRPRLRARVTRILGALDDAADPDVPIVGMQYFDPALGFWGLVPGGRALARASLRAFHEMNVGLVAAYEGAGAAVANVAATFRMHDFKDTLVVPGRGPLPLNVALACKWTWFCSRFAGDPHPNNTGYRKIARTFQDVVEPLI